MQVPSDDVMRALYFQTNFEIVHMEFARGAALQGMFDAFDQSEVNAAARAVSDCVVEDARFLKEKCKNLLSTRCAGVLDASLR